MNAIKGLNHAAYRCRNSEETRRFYEDFLGLPLVDALPIGTTMTGRAAQVLHTFFAMDDGSCIAFFEEPGAAFEFKDQRDFDLHLALTVDMETLHEMFERGKAEGIETRGISDHGFIHSIYFRDPNGYVVELAAPVDKGTGATDEERRRRARQILEEWEAGRG
ncbi:MAG: VOC family protein [Pseudomonadales bacterium]|nr:VOC family protein [Pseudomonadales bacterium]NIX08035.1 VOC family protein [Pseudomonadales bacterium]